MKHEPLKAEKRIVTGKKVRRLRKEGIVPANIYGKSFESLSLQLPISEFEAIYTKVRETGLVDLKVGSDTHPVLIHNVQRNPLNLSPIHVDFYKVNLKEKVKSTIPVIATGEAKAEKEKIGALMQSLMEVEIEALPADLPENIEVNVESLAKIDDTILVSDLKTPDGVEITTSPDSTVFRISELVSQEAEDLEAEVSAEAEAASEESAEEKSKESPTEESEKPQE